MGLAACETPRDSHPGPIWLGRAKQPHDFAADVPAFDVDLIAGPDAHLFAKSAGQRRLSLRRQRNLRHELSVMRVALLVKLRVRRDRGAT
jgi:hypothetical protein